MDFYAVLVLYFLGFYIQQTYTIKLKRSNIYQPRHCLN